MSKTTHIKLYFQKGQWGHIGMVAQYAGASQGFTRRVVGKLIEDGTVYTDVIDGKITFFPIPTDAARLCPGCGLKFGHDIVAHGGPFWFGKDG